MSLPYETQASFLRFLKLALSVKKPDITLSPSLKTRIAHLPKELYDGNLEEIPLGADLLKRRNYRINSTIKV